ncbi:hypothetical protein [Kribbella sp. NPDC006257]|uniref:hypothetical protein n=1 Tax=Kribbella sp. NPDC006257 TaxID=3156738 RepID=UPI0033B09E62
MLPGDGDDQGRRQVAVPALQHLQEPAFQELSGALVGVDEQGDRSIGSSRAKILQEDLREDFDRVQQQFQILLPREPPGQKHPRLIRLPGGLVLVDLAGEGADDRDVPGGAQADPDSRSGQQGRDTGRCAGVGRRFMSPLPVQRQLLGERLAPGPLLVQVGREHLDRRRDVEGSLVDIGRSVVVALRDPLPLPHERGLADPGSPVKAEEKPPPGIVDRQRQALFEQPQRLGPADEQARLPGTDQVLQRHRPVCHRRIPSHVVR